MYGSHLSLLIPMNTYPDQDTFSVGDTLWMEFNFNKNVQLYNSEKSIQLDSFNFFSKLYIAEISDSTANYNVSIDTFLITGELSSLTLTYVKLYPITFIEEKDQYQFKAGIVMNEPGLYYLGVDTNPELYEFYNHPALLNCDESTKKSVDIYYKNSSTSQTDYENIFKQTNVEYLRDLVDYEDYSRGGAICFFVN
jgi:hypothetical protein